MSQDTMLNNNSRNDLTTNFAIDEEDEPQDEPKLASAKVSEAFTKTVPYTAACLEERNNLSVAPNLPSPINILKSVENDRIVKSRAQVPRIGPSFPGVEFVSTEKPPSTAIFESTSANDNLKSIESDKLAKSRAQVPRTGPSLPGVEFVSTEKPSATATSKSTSANDNLKSVESDRLSKSRAKATRTGPSLPGVEFVSTEKPFATEASKLTSSPNDNLKSIESDILAKSQAQAPRTGPSFPGVEFVTTEKPSATFASNSTSPNDNLKSIESDRVAKSRARAPTTGPSLPGVEFVSTEKPPSTATSNSTSPNDNLKSIESDRLAKSRAQVARTGPSLPGVEFVSTVKPSTTAASNSTSPNDNLKSIESDRVAKSRAQVARTGPSLPGVEFVSTEKSFAAEASKSTSPNDNLKSIESDRVAKSQAQATRTGPSFPGVEFVTTEKPPNDNLKSAESDRLAKSRSQPFRTGPSRPGLEFVNTETAPQTASSNFSSPHDTLKSIENDRLAKSRGQPTRQGPSLPGVEFMNIEKPPLTATPNLSSPNDCSEITESVKVAKSKGQSNTSRVAASQARGSDDDVDDVDESEAYITPASVITSSYNPNVKYLPVTAEDTEINSKDMKSYDSSKTSCHGSYEQVPVADVCANMVSSRVYEIGTSQDMYVIDGETFRADEKVLMGETVEYALDVQEIIPDEVIEEKEKRTIFKKSSLIAVIIVSICIAVSVAVGVSVTGKKDPKGFTDSFITPTLAPTGANFGNVTNYIIRSGATLPSIAGNTSSPQNEALRWMSQDNLSIQYLANNSKILLQRYALATLYFSTNGDGWTQCGRQNVKSPCLDGSQSMWLSSDSECNWAGISCSGSEIIMISIGESGIYIILTRLTSYSLSTTRLLFPFSFFFLSESGAFYHGWTTPPRNGAIECANRA